MKFWELVKKNEPLVLSEHEQGALQEGWSRIKIAGCGLCHTDLGFIYTDVPTKHEFPLTLGHEISGVVEEGSLKGRQVIVPAVIPCGECPACQSGNPRICFKQIMPGNDIHGGFAETIDIPDRFIAPLPKEVDEQQLIRMSVIADAVTTPLQAIHNLQLKKGEVAVVIGCGGVGTFAALLAKAFGATVLVMDIDDRKLDKIKAAGIDHTFNVKDSDIRNTKKWVKQTCKENGLPMFAHKIFETSGSKPGQELAFALINYGAKMATVGFTLSKLEVRLSNLMAFDATIVGNWGADPAIYPEAIRLVMDGALDLEPFTESYPLSEINSVIQRAHHEGLDHRAVLVP